MTRDETIALFLECDAKRAEALAAGKSGHEAHEAAKAHWNAWAEGLLAEREAIEVAGRWSPKPANEETRDWLSRAEADFRLCRFLTKFVTQQEKTEVKADLEEQVAEAELNFKSILLGTKSTRFDGFIFPGNVFFGSCNFTGSALFESAKFFGDTWFVRTTFGGPAQFTNATFHADARFWSSVFTGDARFSNATFKDDARFENTAFNGPARFSNASFSADASFENAIFKGFALFENTTFCGLALFKSAAFSGLASFGSANFSYFAQFRIAAFNGDASFERASFAGKAYFEEATFDDAARFANANFIDDAFFENAKFAGPTFFEGASFTSSAFFRAQTFPQDVFFDKAKFGVRGRADFGLTTFKSIAQFDGAIFQGRTDFNAARCERTFSMAGTQFEDVPNFVQAHFAEAPRLDNVKVKVRRSERFHNIKGKRQRPPLQQEEPGAKAPVFGDVLDNVWRNLLRLVKRGIAEDNEWRDVPAHWRALKRLAIQGHDTDRELQFFAGEVRSARFAGDWPAPWPILKGAVWSGFFRFWFGLLYDIFSDFGRSLVRPFLAWSLCIVIFAAYFLGQNLDIAAERRKLNWHGFFGQVIAYSITAWDAAFREPAPACFDRSDVDANQNGFSGLVEQARNKTNLV